jgi:hypothetical protein
MLYEAIILLPARITCARKITPKSKLALGRPKWVIRDPMPLYFNNSMRLNSDNSFTIRVFLNCVYLLYCATC